MSKRNEINFSDCLESDAFKLICKTYCSDSQSDLQKLINLGVGGEEIHALTFGLMQATKVKTDSGKLLSDELLENDAFKRAVSNAVRINRENPISAYALAVVEYAKANSEFVAKNKGKGDLLDCINGKNKAMAETIDLQEDIDKAIEDKQFERVIELKNVFALKKGKHLNLDAITQEYSSVENDLFNVSLDFAVGAADSRSLGLQVVNEGMNNLLMSSLGYSDINATTIGRLETSYKLTGNWKYKAVETLLCGEYYEQKLEDKSEMDNLSVYADEVIKTGAERLDSPVMGE